MVNLSSIFSFQAATLPIFESGSLGNRDDSFFAPQRDHTTWLVLPHIVNWLSCNVRDVINYDVIIKVFCLKLCLSQCGYLKSCYGAYLLFLHCPQTAVQRQNKLRYRCTLDLQLRLAQKCDVTLTCYPQPFYFFQIFNSKVEIFWGKIIIILDCEKSYHECEPIQL